MQEVYLGRRRSEQAQGVEVEAAKGGKLIQDTLMSSYHFKQLGLTPMGSLWQRLNIPLNHQNEKGGSWIVGPITPTSHD